MISPQKSARKTIATKNRKYLPSAINGISVISPQKSVRKTGVIKRLRRE